MFVWSAWFDVITYLAYPHRSYLLNQDWFISNYFEHVFVYLTCSSVRLVFVFLPLFDIQLKIFFWVFCYRFVVETILHRLCFCFLLTRKEFELVCVAYFRFIFVLFAEVSLLLGLQPVKLIFFLLYCILCIAADKQPCTYHSIHLNACDCFLDFRLLFCFCGRSLRSVPA